jgi:hypothetical protein
VLGTLIVRVLLGAAGAGAGAGAARECWFVCPLWQ